MDATKKEVSTVQCTLYSVHCTVYANNEIVKVPTFQNCIHTKVGFYLTMQNFTLRGNIRKTQTEKY